MVRPCVARDFFVDLVGDGLPLCRALCHIPAPCIRVIVLNASVGGGQETAMAIAVVGATGNTGRAVVKELRALGQNPVCVVRNAEKAREVLGADAKTAVAELTDRPALEKALAG